MIRLIVHYTDFDLVHDFDDISELVNFIEASLMWNGETIFDYSVDEIQTVLDQVLDPRSEMR